MMRLGIFTQPEELSTNGISLTGEAVIESGSTRPANRYQFVTTVRGRHRRAYKSSHIAISGTPADVRS